MIHVGETCVHVCVHVQCHTAQNTFIVIVKPLQLKSFHSGFWHFKHLSLHCSRILIHVRCDGMVHVYRGQLYTVYLETPMDGMYWHCT